MGNIIDSTFYGMPLQCQHSLRKRRYSCLPTAATRPCCTVLLWTCSTSRSGKAGLPEWIPQWGGEHFVFFRPVFNIADAAITIGVVLFILAQRSAKREEERLDAQVESPAEETPAEDAAVS
ncbi:MAG: signal peptidase II [Flavobacteriales bacterium]